MQLSNYDTLKNTYHTASNISILESKLDEQGISMDKLPASVRSRIGYVTRPCSVTIVPDSSSLPLM